MNPSNPSTFSVILAAAGKSSRFRDKLYKKVFIPLKDRAVWLHSAERFLNRDEVKQVIIVISPEDREEFTEKFGANVAILGIEVVDGGAERMDSVRSALARVSDKVGYVAVHDAARPCLAGAWIDEVFQTAQKTKAAILAEPITSTIKRVGVVAGGPGGQENRIEETIERKNLWTAQTPQVFERQLLLDAFAKWSGPPATDESQMVEKLGHPVTAVAGSPLNIKITTKDDLSFAAAALSALPKPKTLGPLHPFADDDLWR